MRAITGAVVSSEPCTLKEAHYMITAMCRSSDSYLQSSDCSIYLVALDNAIQDHHKFLRRRGEQQHGGAGHDPRGYKTPVRGFQEIGNRRGYLDGPRGSVEDSAVAVASGEKSKKKKKEVEPRDNNKAEAGVPSHAPAVPEILFEQRKNKKNKEKHSNKESLAVVKQEPDLVVEEDRWSGRKKKDKHSEKELARFVKQEPGLVVEEELASEKKMAKKKREKDLSDGEKKKKHSREEGDSKGVKEEEDKMAIDSDLNSEKKKKKKREREDDGGGDVQEQGEHKKKKRKESRE